MTDYRFQLFSNNALSLLTASIGDSALVIQLQPGAGVKFPQPSLPNQFFLVTLEDIATPFNQEIVKIIGRDGDTLIVDPQGRGFEGTTAKTWLADATLVDHRVTAETMRQAFLLPTQSNTAPGNGAIQYPPTVVPQAETWTVAVVDYDDNTRGNKFWITMFAANGRAQTFELLTIIQGDLASNTEEITWTRTNRIGHNFSGELKVLLDKPNDQIVIAWENKLQTIPVTVNVTRI